MSVTCFAEKSDEAVCETVPTPVAKQSAQNSTGSVSSASARSFLQLVASRKSDHGLDPNSQRVGGNAQQGNFYSNMWAYFNDTLAIRSVLDVGAGNGLSTRLLRDKFGWHATGIDGDHSNVNDDVKFHDFATGAFIPDRIYDLCWSCFVLEHIDFQILASAMKTFSFCRYSAVAIGMNHGGTHHVSIHPWTPWWDNLFEWVGFQVDESLTSLMREPLYGTEDNRKHTWWSGGMNNHAPGKILRNKACSELSDQACYEHALSAATPSGPVPATFEEYSACCPAIANSDCQC